MPQERPRHEPLKLEGYKTFEDSFKDSEKHLKGQGIVNADPPKREKPGPQPAADVIATLQADLKASNNELKAMSKDFVSAPMNDALRNELHDFRGDLAGTFNDRKLEIASTLPREPRSAREIALRKMLDWLQFAEDKGQLADCLERWKEASRANDWDQMAQLADAIRKGIEFDKAVLSEWFDNLDGAVKRDDYVKEARNDVRALLDGIAFEISRAADGALFGSYNPAREMVAAQKTLARTCDRRARAETIAASIDALDASRWIDRGKFATLHDQMSTAQNVLKHWEVVAQDLSKVAGAIAGGNDPGAKRQSDTAKRLDDLDGLAKAMLAVLAEQPGTSAADRTPSVWAKDDLVFTLRQVAESIVQKHHDLALQLTDAGAQKTLLHGTGVQALRDAIAKIDADRKAVNTLYEQALAASAAGSLRKYWSSNRDALLEHVDRLSKSGDKAVADWGKTAADGLKRLFVDDLGPTLDKWNERKDADIYGLTWQLIDTLRSYKAGAERVLSSPPVGSASYAYVSDYARQVLDATLAAVAKDLSDDVAAGRA